MVPRMVPPIIRRVIRQTIPRLTPLPRRHPLPPSFLRGKVETPLASHVEVTKPGSQTPINFSEVVQRSRGIPRFLSPSQARQRAGPEIGPFTRQLPAPAPLRPSRALSRGGPAGVAGVAQSARRVVAVESVGVAALFGAGVVALRSA